MFKILTQTWRNPIIYWFLLKIYKQVFLNLKFKTLGILWNYVKGCSFIPGIFFHNKNFVNLTTKMLDIYPLIKTFKFCYKTEHIWT